MKTESNFKYILRLALTLLIITGCVAAALAGVNALTKPEIDRLNAEKTQPYNLTRLYVCITCTHWIQSWRKCYRTARRRSDDGIYGTCAFADYPRFQYAFKSFAV